MGWCIFYHNPFCINIQKVEPWVLDMLVVSGISLYESGYGLTCRHLNSLSVELDESSLPYLDISTFSKLTNDALIEEIEKTGVVLYWREGSAFVEEV